MAVTYFTPKENTLYSICFQSRGWWELYTSDSIHGRKIDDPSTRNFPNESLWQFFKVSENAYALCSYKDGRLVKITKSNDGYSNLSLGNLQKDTPIFTLFAQDKGNSDKGWVQLSVSTVDSQGIIDAQPDLPGFLRVASVSGFFFSIKEERKNPAAENLSEINAAQEIDEPTFIEGTAPQVYPEAPMLMNEVYVPYFMVNDKTLPNMMERIQQTPYYILRQYGQYEMVAEYKNGSVGTVTFVENWQYGWSATVSANISAQLGFGLGGNIEENEILLKETEEAGIKLTFGIDLGVSASVSESSSKEIQAEAPPSTAIAIYGISAFFKLFQGDGVSAIASPNIPMKMNQRYVSISIPYPKVKES